MIRISVESNIREVARQLTRVQRQAIPAAAARALNKTGQQAKNEAARAIAKRYKVRQRTIKQGIVLTERANQRRLMTIIEAKGRPISLAEFGARQTRKGVTVQVRSGVRKLIRSAWIRHFAGGKAVFARGQYQGGRFVPTPKRLPITKLVTAGIPQMYRQREVEQAIGKKIREVFPRVFAHELRFELARHLH